MATLHLSLHRPKRPSVFTPSLTILLKIELQSLSGLRVVLTTSTCYNKGFATQESHPRYYRLIKLATVLDIAIQRWITEVRRAVQ